MEHWVNIDFKEDLYRLHKSSCLHMKKVPTETKGIQEMKIQGGWFKFKSVRMARAYYQKNHRTLRWKPCQVCDP